MIISTTASRDIQRIGATKSAIQIGSNTSIRVKTAVKSERLIVRRAIWMRGRKDNGAGTGCWENFFVRFVR